ncbi:MAG: EamA family transporter [Methylomonas sp.]|uniref:EamA family transporter n=1 Tax=Methylomonas sp. TaxID=418 RepID=UPI0025E97921|nr:EamA family transporter [Methylomonas sp.]MCK9605419.1 EamA family transporter [Methylomonas sp.]
METLSHITWPTIGAIGYVVYPSTLLGYVAWGRLLSRYPAATVAPFTLLVPVFGISASALVLGEPLTDWKIYAALLVLSGLCINLFGARLAVRRRIA